MFDRRVISWQTTTVGSVGLLTKVTALFSTIAIALRESRECRGNGSDISSEERRGWIIQFSDGRQSQILACSGLWRVEQKSICGYFFHSCHEQVDFLFSLGCLELELWLWFFSFLVKIMMHHLCVTWLGKFMNGNRETVRVRGFNRPLDHHLEIGWLFFVMSRTPSFLFIWHF